MPSGSLRFVVYFLAVDFRQSTVGAFAEWHAQSLQPDPHFLPAPNCFHHPVS